MLCTVLHTQKHTQTSDCTLASQPATEHTNIHFVANQAHKYGRSVCTVVHVLCLPLRLYGRGPSHIRWHAIAHTYNKHTATEK